MADALVSEASVARHEGSTPSLRTNICRVEAEEIDIKRMGCKK